MKVKVMPGSRAAELQKSKDPIDHKKAKLLIEFCLKAEACFYEYNAIQKLRKEYNSII